MPPTKTCMTCHSQIWTHAEILAPVHASFAMNKPLRWTTVYRLSDYVYFNHRIHIAKGVGCEECHGRVDKMPAKETLKKGPAVGAGIG
jgi:Cytochrome c554 and c-prime